MNIQTVNSLTTGPIVLLTDPTWRVRGRVRGTEEMYRLVYHNILVIFLLDVTFSLKFWSGT